MKQATTQTTQLQTPGARTPWGYLPPRMRILFITSKQRTGSWLAEALAEDNAVDIDLEEASGLSDGMARLRDELFDAILVSHQAGDQDALSVLDAIRAGSCEEQPIIVLGEIQDDEMRAHCYEAGGDAYICTHTATTRTLIWEVAKAMKQHELVAENRQLEHSRKHQLQLEHDEASRLLSQQRAMIADLELVTANSPLSAQAQDESEWEAFPFPSEVIDHYRQLLRTYVIMGSGNLADEMAQLCELLSAASVTSQQVLALHIFVLEELVNGLGSRSSRHVMNRADLLILEVMVKLADLYRLVAAK